MNVDSCDKWRADGNVVNDFVFDPDGIHFGINPDLFDNLMHGTLPDFYMLIVNNEVINKIVIETNKYAAQKEASIIISSFSSLRKWYDTNETEIKQLF